MGIDRRGFVVGSVASATLVVAAPWRAWAEDEEPAAGGGLERALRSSPYVYVSPLKANGSESTCHAEVWYGWVDGAVVMTVATERWKAENIRRGNASARIWVGDYGRWKGMLGKDESFRMGPHFDAKGELLWDETLLDKLLAIYDEKYPDEIGRWRDKMRAGNTDKSRVLIRYTPIT